MLEKNGVLWNSFVQLFEKLRTRLSPNYSWYSNAGYQCVVGYQGCFLLLCVTDYARGRLPHGMS